MNINAILSILQVTLSIIIVVLVLLQQQDSGFYSGSTTINQTRRGTEKLVYNLTIFASITFVIISIANFLIQ